MKNKTSFGGFAAEWDAKSGNAGPPASRKDVATIISLLGNLHNKRIYEIACGNGFLSRKLAKKGAQVHASDIAPEMIAIAKEKYKSEGIKYLVQEGSDVKNLPKEYFDAVVINYGIFYIKDLRKLLSGIHGVLKPGGSVICTIPHPLFPLFFEMTHTRSKEEQYSNILQRAQNYLNPHVRILKKRWGLKGQARDVQYSMYHRPLSYYLNTMTQQKFVIEQIQENPSLTIVDGIKTKSSIPGSIIVKATKPVR